MQIAHRNRLNSAGNLKHILNFYRELSVKYFYFMVDIIKTLNVFFLFNFLCLSVQGATLEFAFQLGETQEPRLDRLLPDVARQMAFNKDGTRLIVKQMDGTVVMWDVQTRQNRIICTVPEKRWFAYAVDADQLLVRTADENIAIVNLASNTETTLTKGAYESGSLSANGTLAVLSEGDEQIEVWQIKPSDTIEALEGEQVHPQKLKTLEATMPIRNGLMLSREGQFIAAAGGSYREGEGHRTAIEIWKTLDERPMRIFDTGEILGVWNVLFSPDATLLAVDTQKNAQSGLRVWEIETGRKLLAKSGFEAYWTRALAFSPTSDYLASGDEAANLRVWDISEGESVIWETYPTGIQSLAFSPNGDYLAVALWDATIQILHWRNEQ